MIVSTINQHRPIRIYNLFPLLAGRIDRWHDHLPRIAAMGFDWVFVNPFHQSGGSRSLYAIADHDRLDERFRVPGGPPDDEQVRAFVEAADRHGLAVMMDLVINHAASDGRLAESHPNWFRRNADGSLHHPGAVDPDDPAVRTEWGDLASLDYAEPAARGELLPFWDAYVARHQALGIRGFRCDAAYQVPADVWRPLIASARRRDPRSLFAAETLGCTLEETRSTAGAGFDFLFNSLNWWDGSGDWLLEQYEAFRLSAPSIAFPESHDTERRAVTAPDASAAGVARHLTFHYGLACAFSTGVMMPMGYEFGFRRPLHVVETTPDHWERTGIDIADTVAAYNRLKAAQPVLGREGAQWRLGPPDAPWLALLRLDAGHHAAATGASLLVANPGPRPVAVPLDPLMPAVDRFAADLGDVTPEAAPLPLAGADSIPLAPGQLRLFASRPQPAARPRPLARVPREADRRVAVERVQPEIDAGRHPAKRVVGDRVEVTADIFTDGHEKIEAALLWRPADDAEWRREPMAHRDNDRWVGHFRPLRNIAHLYTVEGWRSPFLSWRDEVSKKRAAGQDVRLETVEGLHLLEAAQAAAEGPDRALLDRLAGRVERLDEGAPERLDLLLADENADLLRRNGPREHVTRHERELELTVDRLAAGFSAWYELFPRSQSGDPARHGTFRDVIQRLPYVREMGFDVLYFPPIHPIGESNRKGRNNAVRAQAGDPGSVYAIGGAAGGHDAVHPDLGTLDDFRELVAAAQAHGLEIALDFAIQCSPDHPWIREHPEWFDWRPDGTLKYAENPPKKYEDIVNVHFYGRSLPDLWLELRRVVLFWVEQGVRIFRVDNPHTKPIPFWRWLIRSVNARHPDVLFLAEAFTRPKMMRMLAKVGFQQSYTYFTWRDDKAGLTEYMTELSQSEMAEYYRPNFFVNTPDINPHYLQTSGRAGFVVRATLAATLAGNYGIYSGFELCEATPLPGREEYLDSEKYEIRAWDWDRPGNIRPHIARLNRIRRTNPALWDIRGLLFLNAWNDHVLAYARLTPARDNVVLVLVNLDPHAAQEADFEVPLWEFGLPDDATIDAVDLLAGQPFRIAGKVQHVRLDPAVNPVAVWRLQRPTPEEGR